MLDVSRYEMNEGFTAHVLHRGESQSLSLAGTGGGNRPLSKLGAKAPEHSADFVFRNEPILF